MKKMFQHKVILQIVIFCFFILNLQLLKAQEITAGEDQVVCSDNAILDASEPPENFTGQ